MSVAVRAWSVSRKSEYGSADMEFIGIRTAHLQQSGPVYAYNSI